MKSQLRIIFHTLRLDFFYRALLKKKTHPSLEQERPKIAIYHSRRLTLWRNLIHFLPVAAALILIILNAIDFYIGSELSGPNNLDDEKLALLTTVAKVHELFMQASIAVIIFDYIREQVVFGDGVPFGGFLAGLQIQSISLLWSSEFAGLCKGDFKKRRTKWQVILLLTTCTILGVSVGPSSSNLMKPRIANWPAGGTDFWLNASNEDLSPSKMVDSPNLTHCATDTGDLSCPYGDWQVLSATYLALWPNLQDMGPLPEIIQLGSRHALREMAVRSRYGSDPAQIWSTAYTVASVGTCTVADAVTQLAAYWSFVALRAAPWKHLQWRKMLSFTVTAPQPYSFASCNSTLVDLHTDTDLQAFFPVLSQSKQASTYTPVYFDTTALDLNNLSPDILRGIRSSASEPQLYWFDDPDLLNTTASSLNAIVTIPGEDDSQSLLFACSMYNRLATDVDYTAVWGTPATSASTPGGFDAFGPFAFRWPKIEVTAAWARYLNPKIAGSNSTILASITSIAGLWNTTTPASPSLYEQIVEAILTTLMANGISRATYNNSMIGQLKGTEGLASVWDSTSWGTQMLPSRWMGPPGEAFEINPLLARNSTKLTMSATINGYAYSWRQSKTQLIWMGVLSLYAFLAVGHFAWSMRKGWISTAWDEPTEMIALAMNSKYCDVMTNMGAGIDTKDVFREKVKVLDVDGHIEIVFPDFRDIGSQVQMDHKYG